jgi:3',5'-cyclic AMP phosphodiesterase CpdA
MAVFAQITDLHLRPRGAAALGRVEVNTFAARAVAALRALRPVPDVVLVTGDITDFGEPAAYDVALRLFRTLAMPVLVMPGNHDARNAFRDAFDGWPGIGGADSERLCYLVDGKDAAVVVLDTLVEGEAHGNLGREQLDWLDQTLGGIAGKPTLIALHHPPMTTGIVHMDRIGLRDAGELGAVVAAHGHVKRIVCGHLHRHIVGRLAHVPAICIPGVAHQVVLDLDPAAPAQFVMEPPAYALHMLTADNDFASHLATVEAFEGPYDYGRAEGVEWLNHPIR